MTSEHLPHPLEETDMERATETGRRHDSTQPATRAADGEPQHTELSLESVVRDLQSVLAAAVERIQGATESEHVAAWALREGGEPYVAAAIFTGSAPTEPSRADFEQLGALAGAVDLRGPGQPTELARLADRFACDAAAVVVANDRTPLAVLLVRETTAAGPAVRPRTLGVLDAARQRLGTPLTAALALGRLRTLDDEVCRLDRLAALGSLASEIAHELRNPLVSIKTFLQLLPERRDDPEFFTSFFEVATAEMRRMERLLDVVLDQARPGNGCGGPVDAGRVLESAAELVRHRADKHQIELLFEAAPDLPAVTIADDALRQVVLNLALNAIDATPDGGSVQLRAIAGPEGVTIAVSDSGPGVPEALRQRVFEPFFTTRDGRTGGLGLAISRRLVEAVRGHIAVGESNHGGAEFRVHLPAAN